MNTHTRTELNKEESYRNELFCGDYTKVFYSRISCTVCDKDLNREILEYNTFEHETLQVLLCEDCSLLSNNQRRVSQCIWCGPRSERTTEKVTCCQCDRIFCRNCIKLNFGIQTFEDAKLRSHISVWVCFICVEKDNFLFLRAICFAIKQCLQEPDAEDEPLTVDANEEESVECVICLASNLTPLEPNIENNFIQLVHCSHQFHRRCFNEWITVNRSCPVCRSRSIQIRNI